MYFIFSNRFRCFRTKNCDGDILRGASVQVWSGTKITGSCHSTDDYERKEGPNLIKTFSQTRRQQLFVYTVEQDWRMVLHS